MYIMISGNDNGEIDTINVMNSYYSAPIPVRVFEQNVAPRFNLAFESGQLSYTENEIDLYNSGVNQLLSLAASRGHSLYHFSANDITEFNGEGYAKMSVLKLPGNWNGTPLEAYKALNKVDEKFLSLSEMDMYFLRADDIKFNTSSLTLLQRLEDDAILLENIRDTLDTTDKYELVRRCPELPSPITYAVDNLEQAIERIGKLPNNEGSFVLKDRFGYGCGAQVHKLDFEDENLFLQVKGYLDDYNKIIVQEYCPEVQEGDLVVTFFDGEMIAAMKRLPKQGEWKTNASLGANEIPHNLSYGNEVIARQVIEKFPGCRFASVDMLESGKLLEINAFPGANGLYRNFGIVIGEKILNKLEKEAISKKKLKMNS